MHIVLLLALLVCSLECPSLWPLAGGRRYSYLCPQEGLKGASGLPLGS